MAVKEYLQLALVHWYDLVFLFKNYVESPVWAASSSKWKAPLVKWGRKTGSIC